jgi:Ser/Thr protein kinase RdoA (MazF antagonist)
MSHIDSISPPLDDAIAVAIHANWSLGADPVIHRHGSGLNSTTWLVTTDTGRWIAKAVPVSTAAQFNAGLIAAACLDTAGLQAGSPVATMTGAISVPVAGCQLALLRHVSGHELNMLDPAEQRIWGATLAQAHLILRSQPIPPGIQGWHWVDPDATHLGVEPWVRPAVRAAVERLRELQQETPLTYGILHADPAPEAFLVDGPGIVALIDWGSVTWGPLLYDLASAGLYAGGEPIFTHVLAGYLDVLPMHREELVALPDLLHFRWAVQADYFARRIQTNDLTGIIDQSGNQEGLADARAFLVEV